MNLNERKNMILNMLQRNSHLGKTAMMKALFLLQQVKGIDLGYDFSIYTYGPYDSGVMEDIDDLVSDGFLASCSYWYRNSVGYNISLTERGNSALKPLPEKESQALSDISGFIRGKSARDLELNATIVYLNDLYARNRWTHDEPAITGKVKEIKPHFTEAEIGSAYRDLKAKKFI